MDKGRIVEQGSHDELIEQNGYYTKLYSYQNHEPVLHEVDSGVEQAIADAQPKLEPQP